MEPTPETLREIQSRLDTLIDDLTALVERVEKAVQQ